VEALRQHRPATVDADERNGRPLLGRVLLDDLVSDPHERAAHSVAVEDNRRCLQL
jgi:hypothetical protein